jgi:hypothetical protein
MLNRPLRELRAEGAHTAHRLLNPALRYAFGTAAEPAQCEEVFLTAIAT